MPRSRRRADFDKNYRPITCSCFCSFQLFATNDKSISQSAKYRGLDEKDLGKSRHYTKTYVWFHLHGEGADIPVNDLLTIDDLTSYSTAVM